MKCKIIKNNPLAEREDKAIVRLGGIGDAVWTLPAVRALCEKGHRVAVHCRKEVEPVYRHNPHVDWIYAYDGIDDVRIYSLITSRFGLYDLLDIPEGVELVMLDGVVERYLQFDLWDRQLGCKAHKALIPGCTACMLAKNARADAVKGKTYVGLLLDAVGCSGAEESYIGELRQTDEETIRAANILDPRRFNILWLMGHQSYQTHPRFPQIIHAFNAQHKDVRVYITGYANLIANIPESDQIKAGQWDLRTTFAMLDRANLVVGSVTGIMNAAGAFLTPKVAMLSTVNCEQFGKTWKNTAWIDPGVPCGPCNQVHSYPEDTCPLDNGWPICKSRLDDSAVLECMEHFYGERR